MLVFNFKIFANYQCFMKNKTSILKFIMYRTCLCACFARCDFFYKIKENGRSAESEGANFWLSVLTDLQNRGVKDILIARVDGLTGFPEAINSIYPKIELSSVLSIKYAIL